MEERDLLPKVIYARTRKSKSEGFEIIFSKNPPLHSRGEQFFTYGVYELRELFITGTGFKLTFKEKPTWELEESSPYKGLSDKKKR
jgi:hypothetical protein